MALTIPRLLAESVVSQLDGDRRPWLAALPGVVEGLAARWDVRVEQPYEPGGTSSWVAPARTATGERVVLKVTHRHPEAEHEAAGLEVWAGRGTVRLLAAVEAPDTFGFLLERCEPGTCLKDAVAEPDQDEVVARLLRRLWVVPPGGHPFRPLAQMCDQWADAYEARAGLGAHRLADPGLARAAVERWRALPRDAGRKVLLATDLHAMNVLAAEREPWLVIDPKPYVGDPHYDALQHLLNCPERLLADPIGLTDRLAGLLDLDAARLRSWLVARVVVEQEWFPDLLPLARRLGP